MQKTELMNQNLKFRRARETDWEWILTSSAPRSSGGSPKTFLLDNKASSDESTWKQRQNHPGDVVCCLTHNMLLLLLHLIEISFLPLSSSVVFLSKLCNFSPPPSPSSISGWLVCLSVRPSQISNNTSYLWYATDTTLCTIHISDSERRRPWTLSFCP